MDKEIGKRWKRFQHILFCQKTLTIMWCLVGGEQKRGEGESDKERILKSMVAQSGENIPFFICFLFWYCFCVVWCLPGMVRSDKILGVVLYGLNLEKRLYEHKQSIKTIETPFSPTCWNSKTPSIFPNQTHTLQKIQQTIRTCSHFHNIKSAENKKDTIATGIVPLM